MKRKSKSRYAILGMISLKPMSGYEIKQSIESSIGYFWQESYGQIYPILKELHTEKLVTSKTRKVGKANEKIVYRITEKGEKELTTWLEEQYEEESYRNELLLKLFFGKKVSLEKNLSQLAKRKKSIEQNIEHFESLYQKTKETLAKNKNLNYWLSTLEYGIEIKKAELRWLSNTQKKFLEEN
ncbi:MAG: PadR family transcriptional regulator [Leptospiraceae bacterium]|nr:PadR family transcriptional regulator [Leptospiraceae bacterium]